jgi:hypothetical protein
LLNYVNLFCFLASVTNFARDMRLFSVYIFLLSLLTAKAGAVISSYPADFPAAFAALSATEKKNTVEQGSSQHTYLLQQDWLTDDDDLDIARKKKASTPDFLFAANTTPSIIIPAPFFTGSPILSHSAYQPVSRQILYCVFRV